MSATVATPVSCSNCGSIKAVSTGYTDPNGKTWGGGANVGWMRAGGCPVCGSEVEMICAEEPCPLCAGPFHLSFVRVRDRVPLVSAVIEGPANQHDTYHFVLGLARDFQGEESSEVVLKKGEALFGKLEGASLIEDRVGKGEWKGRSQGVSIPVGSFGGRSVRYRVGTSKGHYVRGAPVATAIDTGTIFITNRRVIFRGHTQNRECVFDKLISCEHLDDGELVLAVSNRQKNTVLHYGPDLNDWFRIHYEVAFADYQGTRDQLVAEVEARLAELDRDQPTSAPIVAAPKVIPPPAPNTEGHPAEWAADPTGRHEYRYWDGNTWTDHVSDGGVTGTDPPD